MFGADFRDSHDFHACGPIRQALYVWGCSAPRAGIGGGMVAQAATAPVKSSMPPVTAIVLVVFVVAGCSLYANLSTLVKNPINYKFFPPFEAWRNANNNHHLGAEYYSIAGALVAGRGYA